MANAQQTIPNDVYVAGQLTCQTFSPPSACIADAAVATAAAGKGIQASKMIQRRVHEYTNGNTAASALSETRRIRTVKGQTGTILEFAAGAEALLSGTDTCTVDLQKNGVSILTSVISLLSSDTAGALKAAAGYISTTLVTGDILRIVVTATHNSGVLPQGVFARLTFDEDAQ